MFTENSRAEIALTCSKNNRTTSRYFCPSQRFNVDAGRMGLNQDFGDQIEQALNFAVVKELYLVTPYGKKRPGLRDKVHRELSMLKGLFEMSIMFFGQRYSEV